ncbi:hypothetical protein [Lactobacillus terrae]|uniref:hypothetical protein n=1 Tax=Lactobacillus terrae TaxID=2269374 RepID=UPI000C1B73B0|nr:hypothetical protein [Lactobacillus terrae]
MWNIILTILHWMIAIPIYGGVGCLLVGTYIGINNYFRETIGEHWIFKIKSMNERELQISEAERDFKERRKLLLLDKNNIQTKSEELKTQFHMISVKENVLNGLIHDWEDQHFTATNYLQKSSYKKMIADIEKGALRDKFLKTLKSYSGYINLNVDQDSVPVSHVVIDELRLLLKTEFNDSIYKDFVLKKYGNAIQFGYNPVVTIWELYRIYGSAY